jgi:hypothetical protein
MRRCDRAQFRAGDGMTDQHRPLQFQRADYSKDIVAKAIDWVIRGRETRGTEPAPRDAVHVVIARELRRKLVEHVRGVPAAGQQDYRFSSAAPIQHFQPDAPFYSYEPHGVG